MGNNNAYFGWSWEYHCRWCQTPFRSRKRLPKGGFCSSRCKQAHYRAYKNYVTRF